jgi:hypothetical protein
LTYDFPFSVSLLHPVKHQQEEQCPENPEAPPTSTANEIVSRRETENPSQAKSALPLGPEEAEK